MHEISRYDERGPAWAWNWLEIGEHVGAPRPPVHWISCRDGIDVSQVPPRHLVAPAVVIDRSTESAEDPDYLLTVEDIRAFEAEHGSLPDDGWLLLRTGWDARAHDAELFLNAGSGRPRARLRHRVRPLDRRGVTTCRRRWRPSVSTRARQATSTRRSRCTTTFSVRGSTASRCSTRFSTADRRADRRSAVEAYRWDR